MKKGNGLFMALIPFIIWAYFTVCWIINLIQFIRCDFNAPWKEEIIHGVGLFTGVGAGLTVWF